MSRQPSPDIETLGGERRAMVDEEHANDVRTQLRARIGHVCSAWLAANFDRLIDRMAAIYLKYESATAVAGPRR